MPNGYIKKGENEFFSFFLLGSLGVKSPLFRLIKVPLVRCFVTKGFFSKLLFYLKAFQHHQVGKQPLLSIFI